MSTSSNTITTYFALLALACNGLVIAVAIAWTLRRRRPALWNWTSASLGPSALTLGAVIAIIATDRHDTTMSSRPPRDTAVISPEAARLALRDAG